METLEKAGAACTRAIEAFLWPHADAIVISVAVVALVVYGIAMWVKYRF